LRSEEHDVRTELVLEYGHVDDKYDDVEPDKENDEEDNKENEKQVGVGVCLFCIPVSLCLVIVL
jgi:hypothetical protein